MLVDRVAKWSTEQTLLPTPKFKSLCLVESAFIQSWPEVYVEPMVRKQPEKNLKADASCVQFTDTTYV